MAGILTPRSSSRTERFNPAGGNANIPPTKANGTFSKIKNVIGPASNATNCKKKIAVSVMGTMTGSRRTARDAGSQPALPGVNPSAASPRSPVLMRSASSTGRMNIFPSPRWPVWELW